jgi:hypothetical protein
MVVDLLLVDVETVRERVGVVGGLRELLQDAPGEGRGERADPRGLLKDLDLTGHGPFEGLFHDPAADHATNKGTSSINNFVMVAIML